MAYNAPRLIFTKEDGLIKAHITMNPSDYDVVCEYLVQKLGDPAPIIYELWAGRVDFDGRSEW